MASGAHTEFARPGDVLVVVHEFQARSPDELSLARGDRVELIERDDDFGDGWFLGRNTENGDSGLFPEVYTRPAPKPTISAAALHYRAPEQQSTQSLHHEPQSVDIGKASSEPLNTQPLPTSDAPASAPPSPDTNPLQPLGPSVVVPSGDPIRTSVPTTTPRSLSATLGADLSRDEHSIGSPVMNETLSVIDEHITGMGTPRHSIAGKDARDSIRDSGSEYSSHHRLSYLHGQETEDEEQNVYTEQEVASWSPARVAEYLEDVGVEKKHCDIFKEQEINGEVLLAMDQPTIFLKEFELGPVGPRLRTWLKIKALQQEVKAAKDALEPMASFDMTRESTPEPSRNRATSMRSQRESQGPRASQPKQLLLRANSTAGHVPGPFVEATSPLVHTTPASPQSPRLDTPTRPSAASIRSMNHNRRHSSIDYSQYPPTPGKSQPPLPSSHKKTPSFDRNWSMGPPQRSLQELRRPESSHHHGHSASTDGSAFGTFNRETGMNPMDSADIDRGYFSGNEVDNRKARNVLRKKENTSHSRNASYSTEQSRRSTFNRRHSRMGSQDSGTESLGSPVSPAAKAYYGASIKSHRSSSAFDFVRPLKPMNEMAPTVTKLDYTESPSMDAMVIAPPIPSSETSSQGRASPSPAAQTYSYSFFGKKSRSTGLRAISDAITGSERAHASAVDAAISTSIKESPVQSPTRPGSSTPSGTSISKSFDLETPEANKRLTSGSTSTISTRKKNKKHTTSAYLRGRLAITPQEAMMGCDYSGWMKKKSSSLMTTWKTRLFVLRGRRLSYYYTEFDTEEKGLIDISSHRVLPANNEKMTGFHAAITRASSSPSSPHNATIPTTASADSANAIDEGMEGMFIFKLVPPRAGLQKGVQFTKPLVHYFAVDNIQLGRLWMAALMKATIDRDDSLSVTTTYQQKTISLEKAQAMRQRPPALMDDDDFEDGSGDFESKNSGKSKESESIQESVIPEEDERQGLAISGLDDAKALLEYAENGAELPTPNLPAPQTPASPVSSPTSPKKHKRKTSFTPGLVSPVG